jgi:hypothetical protein
MAGRRRACGRPRTACCAQPAAGAPTWCAAARQWATRWVGRLERAVRYRGEGRSGPGTACAVAMAVRPLCRVDGRAQLLRSGDAGAAGGVSIGSRCPAGDAGRALPRAGATPARDRGRQMPDGAAAAHHTAPVVACTSPPAQPPCRGECRCRGTRTGPRQPGRSTLRAIGGCCSASPSAMATCRSATGRRARRSPPPRPLPASRSSSAARTHFSGAAAAPPRASAGPRAPARRARP